MNAWYAGIWHVEGGPVTMYYTYSYATVYRFKTCRRSISLYHSAACVCLYMHFILEYFPVKTKCASTTRSSFVRERKLEKKTLNSIMRSISTLHTHTHAHTSSSHNQSPTIVCSFTQYYNWGGKSAHSRFSEWLIVHIAISHWPNNNNNLVAVVNFRATKIEREGKSCRTASLFTTERNPNRIECVRCTSLCMCLGLYESRRENGTNVRRERKQKRRIKKKYRNTHMSHI